MAQERPSFGERFGLTERESLFDRVSHQRFMVFLQDEAVQAHEAQVSTNLYGEFLFVTLSREVGEQPTAATFFGLGFHEHRERWITEEWFYYETTPRTQAHPVSKAEIIDMVQQRHHELVSNASNTQQSRRAKLFEMLADLTDEDGALTEMEDLGDMDWLDDDE